ncbi:MAG: hypothetical protein PWP51_1339 [Clostridiales bacterium]|nr:hypothetical protein [Clostridiales bacterium]
MGKITKRIFQIYLESICITRLRGMDINIDFSQIRPHKDRKAGLIAGLCQQIQLSAVFDALLAQHTGRPPEIPYGSMAQLMLINLADDHHPLWRMKEYFADKNIESLLGHPVELSKLNDDRFGGFLDAMQAADCKKIYLELSTNAFRRYSIAFQREL